MLTVDDFAEIRRAHRDGLSIRAIARQFGRSRRKVREALSKPEPRPFQRGRERSAPKLGGFHAVIEQILSDDEKAPPKQRHTSQRLFERLRDEHQYLGGYDSVRRYVAKLRQRHVETFIPLAHDAGQRLEADFGHIYVDFPDGRRQIPVLLLVWSYSNCPFAVALPSERTEAILDGMTRGFAFFECVPREVWWDNPKTVAAEIFSGRERRLHPRYRALASHYVFEPLFCLPAHGNEKPCVENRVKTLQRRWATPVPKAANLAEFNAYLRACCLKDRGRVSIGRTSSDKQETIGARFERDRDNAMSLPATPFDACVYQPAKVDKYQTVRFDHVYYSVPRSFVGQKATVKAYPERIEIVVGATAVARHERCYERGEQVLEPLHYLASLPRRPAALDHAPVFRKWRLPAIFQQIRQRLEDRHGPHAGVRQFIRVLQLLAEHPLERVQQVLEHARGADGVNVDVLIQRVRHAALQANLSESAKDDNVAEHRHEALRLQVPTPNLKSFDQFLKPDPSLSPDAIFAQGEADEPRAVVTRQFEATSPADHVERV